MGSLGRMLTLWTSECVQTSRAVAPLRRTCEIITRGSSANEREREREQQ